MPSVNRKNILAAVTVACAIALFGALAWMTQDDSDPCDRIRQDVGAAILADDDYDQDALHNRSIVVRANCEQQ